MSVTTEFHLNSILGLAKARSLHDLGGPQLVAPVNHGDPGAEARQEDGLLHGGVATSGHCDVLLAEEEAVAGGAGRDPVAEQAVLVGHAEHERASAGGDDDRVGDDSGLVGPGIANPQLERPGREVEAADLRRAKLGLEAQGLGAHRCP